MTKLSEQIKEREKELGRSLTSSEKFVIVRSQPSKDDTADRMEIALTETAEGQALAKAFKQEIEKAAIINNTRMRHVAALDFEAGKRDLLVKFNAGTIERIGKS